MLVGWTQLHKSDESHFTVHQGIKCSENWRSLKNMQISESFAEYMLKQKYSNAESAIDQRVKQSFWIQTVN